MLGKKALSNANKKRARSETWSDPQIEELARKRDLLPNLELLEGPVNIDKSDTAPDTWAIKKYGSGADYSAFLERNALPALPHEIDQFLTFFETRRGKLAKLLKEKLGTVSPSTLVGREASAETAGIDEDLADADLDT
jgi:hypothetical protein